MKKTYDYCERCAKPIELKREEQNYTYALCFDCAAELLKKIYGEGTVKRDGLC